MRDSGRLRDCAGNCGIARQRTKSGSERIVAATFELASWKPPPRLMARPCSEQTLARIGREKEIGKPMRVPHDFIFSSKCEVGDNCSLSDACPFYCCTYRSTTSCAISSTPKRPNATARRQTLVEREHLLWERHAPVWRAYLPPILRTAAFASGFVEAIHLTAAEFLINAEAIFARPHARTHCWRRGTCS